MRSLAQLVAGFIILLSAGRPGSAQSLSFGSPETAAKVMSLTGQVSVLRDSGPWALNEGSLVHVKQVIVTGADGFATFQITDGSTFEVYPNSRVTFRNNPSSLKDLLDVWLGRVRVHIQKLSGQPNHQRIKTPTAVISVRGTVFDIDVEGEESTLVSVTEGLVEVDHAQLPSKQPKLLGAGETLRVYKDIPLAKSSPNRDAVLQQGMRAATEALYRVIFGPRNGGGPAGAPAPRTGGGSPLPGETEPAPPPPPPID